MPGTGEITRWLQAWRAGDESAFGRLVPLIYVPLRRMASARLRGERSGHTLQTTALVNEAYLRLVDQDRVPWRDRVHFFAVAARTMRRILCNYARDRNCAKRGGGREPLPFDEAAVLDAGRMAEWLELDQALDALAVEHPVPARVVEMRYFGGLSRQEIADVLDCSVPTVGRHWRLARAWLFRHLRQEQGQGTPELDGSGARW